MPTQPLIPGTAPGTDPIEAFEQEYREAVEKKLAAPASPLDELRALARKLRPRVAPPIVGTTRPTIVVNDDSDSVLFWPCDPPHRPLDVEDLKRYFALVEQVVEAPEPGSVSGPAARLAALRQAEETYLHAAGWTCLRGTNERWIHADCKGFELSCEEALREQRRRDEAAARPLTLAEKKAALFGLRHHVGLRPVEDGWAVCGIGVVPHGAIAAEAVEPISRPTPEEAIEAAWQNLERLLREGAWITGDGGPFVWDASRRGWVPARRQR